jgi:hypothetical protein
MKETMDQELAEALAMLEKANGALSRIFGIEEEGEKMSMKTYIVTLELTSEFDPREWNWDNFLNLDIEEGYQVLSIKEGEGK